MTRILAIDDDPQVLNSIVHVLDAAGYEVLTAYSGMEGLRLLEEYQPELVILDMIMPEMGGLEVCRRIRANPFTAKLPIMFLTAKRRPSDVIEGFDTGADDYLVKPLEVVELPARIRARLRRTSGGILDPETDILVQGELVLALNRLEVSVGGQVIELTATEHRLLHYLMQNAGRPYPPDQLLADVWEYPFGVGDPQLVRVHITKLRNKIEPNPDKPQFILNLYGKGYLVPR